MRISDINNSYSKTISGRIGLLKKLQIQILDTMFCLMIYLDFKKQII